MKLEFVHRAISPSSSIDYQQIIPEPRTIEEWDQREFADEVDTGFSSFSYFIGLYRSFEFCLFGKPRDTEEAVKRICTCADAGIVAFRSFCFSTHRRLMGESGHLDSFMFKSNFGIVV
jgi:hypothetical protein